MGLLISLLMCLLICPATPVLAGSSAQYTVARGDNLTVIARRFGVTVDELRHTNSLASDRLAIGQKLAVDRPFHRWYGKPVRWQKPVARTDGVLRSFGPYKVKRILMPSTGVDVATPLGTPIRCPADGIVRHIGHMDRFGTLMILEHGDGYATVLSPFDPDQVNVKVGQALRQGYLLGKSGEPEPDSQPHVHIELRRNDKAIDPDRLLR